MSLPRYPKYKDSGVEWLGHVPEHWDIQKLKSALKPISNKASQKSNPIALENIESWTGGIIDTVGEFQGDGIAFEKDDILFGKLRPYLAKVYLAKNAGEAVGDFFVLRPQNSINPTFAKYLLLSRVFINWVNSSTYGAKMPRVSWEFMANTPLPLPSLDEQVQLVRFIESHTTQIDRLVAEQEKLISLLNEKRQALISQAVTKGLNPHVRLKDSGVEWLGHVPEHWELLPLFTLMSEKQEPNLGMKVDNVLSLSYGRIVDRNVESNDGLLPESFETYQIVKPSDVILRLTDLQNDKRSLRVGRVEKTGIITSAYLCLQAKGKLDPKFGFFYLNACDLMKVFYGLGGGVRQSMKFEDLKRLPLLLPPIAEQQAIVDFLESHTTQIDALIQEAQRGIELLKERRSALISAAVTGQIDVRGVVESVEL